MGSLYTPLAGGRGIYRYALSGVNGAVNLCTVRPAMGTGDTLQLHYVTFLAVLADTFVTNIFCVAAMLGYLGFLNFEFYVFI